MKHTFGDNAIASCGPGAEFDPLGPGRCSLGDGTPALLMHMGGDIQTPEGWIPMDDIREDGTSNACESLCLGFQPVCRAYMTKEQTHCAITDGLPTKTDGDNSYFCFRKGGFSRVLVQTFEEETCETETAISTYDSPLSCAPLEDGVYAQAIFDWETCAATTPTLSLPPSEIPTTSDPTSSPTFTTPTRDPSTSPIIQSNYVVELTIVSLLSCDSEVPLSGDKYFIQVADINFFDELKNQISYDSFVVEDGDSPSGELPERVTDNNSGTKWLDRGFSCSGNYVSGVASGFSGVPAYYTFVTANDSPPRDPNGWNVRLCHNGSCGQTIRVRDQVTPSARRTQYDILYDFMPDTLAPSLPPVTSSPTSSRPTEMPTDAPSFSSPTAFPQISDPTYSPTLLPSVSEPSFFPSISEPTNRPSSDPSTTAPTDSPSNFPSISIPTNFPSRSPATSSPSRIPSNASPSQIPSNVPTSNPLAPKPTRSPDMRPTFTYPSSMPTSRPSDIPSTAFPTQNPTSTFPPDFPPDEDPGDCSGSDDVYWTTDCLRARVEYLQREVEDTREICAADHEFCDDVKLEIEDLLST